MKLPLPVSLALLALGVGTAHAQNAAATFSIDAAQGRHAISPNIYGVSFASAADMAALNCPLNRWGGNAATRHNWQQNASNRAADYYFESISDDGTAPGAAADKFIGDTRTGGGQPMITIPTIGWIAKLGTNRDKLASFSVKKYGAQQSTDYWMPDAGNGVRTNGQNITGNDPNDANTPNSPALQGLWVDHLKNKWGTAANGGVRYYLMDNETSIWFATHRDVHPAGQTMQESRDGILAYSAAVKASDPGALVVGPEEWGWSGYLLSGADQKWSSDNQTWWNQPDKTAHGGMDYLPWLLKELKASDAASGKKSLDVFSVHYYPQGGEFSDDTSQAMQLRRNRSTRSLWDPNYTDETWINDKVQLVPRLKGWVGAGYPGLQTGITEYSWGADNHVNGATAEADVLGILGREGLDMANRWTSPASGSFAFKAMQMYRNYDGQKSCFGDTAVKVTSTTNPDSLAVFAAQRTVDGALTVMAVSKVLTGTTPLSLNLANVTANAAQAWQLTATGNITRLADAAVTGGVLNATLPAQSVTLFVLGAAAPPTGVPGVKIVVPIAGAALKSLAWVSGTATDDVAVTRVTLIIRNSANLYWDGAKWSSVTAMTTALGGTAKNATWARSTGLPVGANLPEGAYAITAKAYDADGHVAAASLSFRVDLTAPLAVIKTPVNNSTVASLTAVTGTATDNTGGTGIKTVNLSLKRVADGLYWTGTTWAASIAWPAATVTSTTVTSTTWKYTALPRGAALMDGVYAVSAYATDKSGNKSPVVTSQFTLKQATAGARSLSPVTLSSFRASADGTIRLTFTGALRASSSDGAKYTVTVNEAPVEILSAQQASAPEVVLTVDGMGAGARVSVRYDLQDGEGRRVVGSAGAVVK